MSVADNVPPRDADAPALAIDPTGALRVEIGIIIVRAITSAVGGTSTAEEILTLVGESYNLKRALAIAAVVDESNDAPAWYIRQRVEARLKESRNG